MPLTPGTRLGPYEIVAPLGAGGMGEVFRAHDSRLGRDVAIKVLPEHLAATAESRARFEREARAVSRLNHPHICTLHDVGREGDTDYLVLELIEGETLAARLHRGALPTAEVLRIGAQVADALDRAHRAGVIHRDLKPGNVMLTKSGAKLMDFGLARASAAAAPGSSSVTMGELVPSPTMGAPLTGAGTIVGTFQYMAPEQLEGGQTDARADLWALGCLLYEMASGRPAFAGRSPASLISAILSSQPVPVSQVAPLSPRALDRLVAACLAKDPADRVQSAHDVRLQLQWMGEAGSPLALDTVAVAPEGSRSAGGAAWTRAAWFPWAALAIGMLGLAAAAYVAIRPRKASGPIVLEIPRPRDLTLGPWWSGSAVSPDGRSVVAMARRGGVMRLWLWRLESPDPVELAGTDEPFLATWSPDSRSVAFVRARDGALFRTSAAGGSPTRICAMPDSRGIAWSSKNILLFAPTAAGPIYQVPAGGGTPSTATILDSTRGEASHRFPSFLPDGEHFLFTTLPAGPNGFRVYVGKLGSKEVKHVLDAGCAPIHAAPGYLVFVDGGKIVAQRFDAGRLAVTGERLPLADAPAETDLTGEPVASASRDGRLLFPSITPPPARLEWLDRSGAPRGTIDVAEGNWLLEVLSPDQRFAFAFQDRELWRVDMERAVSTRLVASPETRVAVSPDGSRIALNPEQKRIGYVTVLPSGGSSGARDSVRTVSALFQEAVDWAPDGRSLLLAVLGLEGATGVGMSWDLWTVPLDGSGPPRPYLATGALERAGRISPDGKWILCVRTVEGRVEAFIDSYPVPGERMQVLANEPNREVRALWGRGGREVLYSDREGYMTSLPLVFEGDGVRAGRPARLFRLPPGLTAIRTRDGERFLVSHTTGNAPGPALRLVLDWPELLKK